MNTTYLSIEGMRIAIHQSAGSGPAALLVHGNSSSAQSFKHQIDGPLGAEFRLCAIDLPGHGMSDNAPDPASAYSLPGFARVIIAAATQLGITDGVILGWSLGGHIVLEASDRLDSAAGFCIFGTPPIDGLAAMPLAFLPDPSMDILFKGELSEDEVATRVAGMFQPDAQLPEQFFIDVRRSDGNFRTHFLKSMGAGQFRDEVAIVAELAQPLAVLHGGRERVVSGNYIKALAMPTLWRGAVQQIDEAGHTPQWETPAQFDALLRDFLNETARP